MKTIALAASLLLSTNVYANSQVQSCPEGLQAKADQAYIEYFPLLEQARWMQTDMTLAWGEVRGTNELHHSRQLIDHTFKGVVGPNNDTLYTKATVDVSQGPVVLTMPKIKGRYSSVLQLDSMHYEVGVDVKKAGKTVWVRSGYEGPIPKHDRLYRVNSDLMYILIRTEVVDSNDVSEVHELQDQMKLEGALRQSKDIFPAMDADFVTRANSLLEHTSLSEANQKNAKCYADIGILSDSRIDRKILDAAVEKGQAWMKANESNLDTSYFNSEENTPRENHQQGRAIANYLWHLAFQPKHADYPNIEVDSDGNTLNGDSFYTLTFNKDVPVNEFWSMTTYIKETKLFVPNHGKIYKVGDKTAVLNEDGETITITYSAAQPKNATNWQPTPKGEDFYIGVRLYEAKEAWLNGSYKLPVPVKIRR